VLLGIAYGGEALNAGTLITTLPGLFTLQGGYQLAPSLLSGTQHLWLWPVLLAIVHYAMVFRGVLFRELATGSWRVRSFRSWLR
jgi:membrane protease YdiL (CAAX protease family)